MPCCNSRDEAACFKSGASKFDVPSWAVSLCTFLVLTPPSVEESLEISRFVGVRQVPSWPTECRPGPLAFPSSRDSAALHHAKMRSSSAQAWSTCVAPRLACAWSAGTRRVDSGVHHRSSSSPASDSGSGEGALRNDDARGGGRGSWRSTCSRATRSRSSSNCAWVTTWQPEGVDGGKDGVAGAGAWEPLAPAATCRSLELGPRVDFKRPPLATVPTGDRLPWPLAAAEGRKPRHWRKSSSCCAAAL
mmetsp:Transcript_127635/g.367278  ORF Transcript_127635/g.367278 Transcript_127635/m.367278 type:complete len:247 (-) Transcript_127635:253-993(-)